MRPKASISSQTFLPFPTFPVEEKNNPGTSSISLTCPTYSLRNMSSREH